MMRKRWALVALVVAVAVAAGLGLRFLMRPSQVEVTRPIRREVVELVVATGYLKATRQSDVGSDIAGIVDEVRVREGDVVRSGDVVVILRRQALEDRVAQLRSSVERSEAELQKVDRAAYPEDLALARAELRRARDVNSALLDAERERLKKLDSGGRSEERKSAEAQLAKVRAAREHAEADLRRAEQLFTTGAIARADLDSRRANASQARATEDAAVQAVSLANMPAREEDTAAARANVRAAEATLKTSVDAAQQRLNSLLQQPRMEDVRVARARLFEARSALREALTAREKADVRVPFDGIITSRLVEPGQGVAPSQTLVRLADVSAAEIRVETDEANLPKLRLGQTALVFAPAYRTTPFKATLTRIGPGVDKKRGVVELQLLPRRIPTYLRPDMTVDVNLEVTRLPNALALPISSVLQDGGEPYVLVPQGGMVSIKNVTVLASSADWVAVEGISKNQRVVVRADSVRSGARIRLREVPTSVR
jgi:HlyD family secretion protein